ncbi:DMT family transporter [Vibrio sp. SCSIO 43136]|uniref:DMT family transporter n=1 Tax=Vibrio sp. SCSIO 43136 TaxID=2819101 RepID=UPI0020758C43|nr:DMT family transporter [Vibrio sp. SCSIO 43136]USD67436.1 DMT family transporter [Vibrio sp. SCSIO 43136]
MLSALTFFCLMAVSARELSGDINIFQTLATRSFVGLVIVCSILLVTKQPLPFRTPKLMQHIFRNSFHFTGQYGWFFAIGFLPLAEVFALEFTVPVWTALIAWLFLGETLTRRKMGSILLGLAGVALIVKPGIEVISWPALVMLGAAFCFAITHTATKSLSSSESALTIVFFMCLIQLPLGLLFATGHWKMPSMEQWFWLMVISTAALVAHYSMSQAMRFTEVTTVVVMDFFRLPIIGVVGVVLYQESFDISLLIGTLLGRVDLSRPNFVQSRWVLSKE